MIDKDNRLPIDCKIFCFNGKVSQIGMIVDNGLDSSYRRYYDRDWNILNRNVSQVTVFQSDSADKEKNIAKPKDLDQIICMSEILAKNFIHVRVDWFYINKRFYNGELTFYAGNGLNLFKPKIWDKILGDELELPGQA